MPNDWVIHVKKCAKEKGLSYMCAATDEECKRTYRDSKPPKPKKAKKAAKAAEPVLDKKARAKAKINPLIASLREALDYKMDKKAHAAHLEVEKAVTLKPDEVVFGKVIERLNTVIDRAPKDKQQKLVKALGAWAKEFMASHKKAKAAAEPPAKLKPYKYMTREEKQEYSRLEHQAEQAKAAAEPPKAAAEEPPKAAAEQKLMARPWNLVKQFMGVTKPQTGIESLTTRAEVALIFEVFVTISIVDESYIDKPLHVLSITPRTQVVSDTLKSRYGYNYYLSGAVITAPKTTAAVSKVMNSFIPDDIPVTIAVWFSKPVRREAGLSCQVIVDKKKVRGAPARFALFRDVFDKYIKPHFSQKVFDDNMARTNEAREALDVKKEKYYESLAKGLPDTVTTKAIIKKIRELQKPLSVRMTISSDMAAFSPKEFLGRWIDKLKKNSFSSELFVDKVVKPTLGMFLPALYDAPAEVSKEDIKSKALTIKKVNDDIDKLTWKMGMFNSLNDWDNPGARLFISAINAAAFVNNFMKILDRGAGSSNLKASSEIFSGSMDERNRILTKFQSMISSINKVLIKLILNTMNTEVLTADAIERKQRAIFKMLEVKSDFKRWGDWDRDAYDFAKLLKVKRVIPDFDKEAKVNPIEWFDKFIKHHGGLIKTYRYIYNILVDFYNDDVSEFYDESRKSVPELRALYKIINDSKAGK